MSAQRSIAAFQIIFRANEKFDAVSSMEIVPYERSNVVFQLILHRISAVAVLVFAKCRQGMG